MGKYAYGCIPFWANRPSQINRYISSDNCGKKKMDTNLTKIPTMISHCSFLPIGLEHMNNIYVTIARGKPIVNN
nr:hypothetical protein [uncultured bacterium]